VPPARRVRRRRRLAARRILAARPATEYYLTKSIEFVDLSTVSPRFDLHQHLWPERLIALLARRRTLPRLWRSGAEWRLRLRGEPDCAVDLAAHDPARRAALAAQDELEHVLICLSTPLGIEALPAEEALPLLEAFHSGVREVGAPFGLWGAPALAVPAPAAVDELAAAGAQGISLPAAAIGSAEGLQRVRPVLARAQERGLPVLVHPGPAPETAATAVPAWWPALSTYVSQMHAAWLAFTTWGLPAHPRLRIVFAMLAGLGPLHAERLAARGAPTAGSHDAATYYDVSSYGPRAIDAMIRAVGIDQLVLGSDRPVASPPRLAPLGAAAQAAIARTNPARVLHGAAVPA
jgi:hypothetical protein